MAMKRKNPWGGSAAKKRRFRSKRKRIVRRKWNRRRGGKMVTRISPAPVPDRLFTKVRYRDVFEMLVNNATTPVASKTYRSSMYDPDLTNIGHKPLWTDQLATLFKNYRIHGMKYRLNACNDQGSRLVFLAVQESDTTAETLPNMNNILERRNARRFLIGSNDKPARIKGYMPTGRPWGLTKQGMKADEDFEALFGTNPVKVSHLNLYAATNYPGATVTVTVEINLEIVVECFRRQQIGGS